ncbi:DNA primase/helicase [Ralstonia phage RSB2]|uniref:DNA helicase/primase n=1 Tax=Ralstonia phage RSB2 TaxID=913183 RepID=E5RV09_9CAUD|nr:DNA primase/helicase [Ralstonia phage RSB2]BAJ51817.1 DNA primase/helicase-like protein [Ralstonia phage RSB2]
MARQDNDRDESSDFVRHVPCDECGSSDANSLYTDGHQYCFACETYVPGDGQDLPEGMKGRTNRAEGTVSMGQAQGQYKALPVRGLSEETCRKFGYWVGKVKGELVQVADYRDTTGALLGQKLRNKDKEFSCLGKVSRDHLWGSNLWSGKGKMIVITEGEIDAMSVSQLQGNKWPVVSLPTGAKAAAKTLAANYEYLDGYDKIVLMFDNDEPGQQAVQESCEVLPAGKVFIAKLPLKDANACLIDGQGAAVMDAIWNASPYRPDGVVAARDLIDRIKQRAVVKGIDFPMGVVLNQMTLGVREGEVVMLTSGSGMGKSSFARECAYGWGRSMGYRIGMAFIEESVEETCLDIAGLHLNKRIRQYPDAVSVTVRDEALHDLFENDSYHLYDHFGSAGEDSLLNKLRFMVTVLGCQFIILDHLSIVVSGMDEAEDERKTIDRLMTKLKTLAKTTGGRFVVISHLKRKDSKSTSHEEGGQISLSELRGSGAIAQLSDTVIGFERDQQGEDPNLVTIRILKCRFTGDTGVAGFLRFNKETGRLVDAYETHGQPEGFGEDDGGDDDIPF